MMKINILRSSFQTDDFVWNEYAELIDRLKNEIHPEIQINGNEFSKSVMIATGGVENLFKTLFSVETRHVTSLQRTYPLHSSSFS